MERFLPDSSLQYKVPSLKMLKEGFLFTFISAFMALFPVANPVGAGFLVNGLLSGLNDEDRRAAWPWGISCCRFSGFRSRSSNWAEDC